MRAALYASTTAADLGRSATDDVLPELRRYAEMQGWTVVAERADVCPNGVGKRPGFEELEQLIAAKAVDVLVTDSLHRLFRDVAQFAKVGPAWLELGLALVATQQSFDATTPAGFARLLDAVTLLAEWQIARFRERQRIGYLRAKAAADGDLAFGRPAVVNPLEVKTLYDRGFSNNEIVAKVTKAGGRLSKGTLWREIQRQRALGLLDESARAKALLARGRLDKGGRRIPGGKALTAEPVVQLFERGVGARRMVVLLRAQGYRVAQSLLRELLDGLDSRGQLDHAKRAEAQRQMRLPKPKPQAAA